jgi:hypothetical protein
MNLLKGESDVIWKEKIDDNQSFHHPRRAGDHGAGPQHQLEG